MQNEIGNKIKEFLNEFQSKVIKIKNNLQTQKKQTIINNLLNNSIKKFFTQNPLSQIMDEKNPIDEITQKRKISYSKNNKESKSIQKNSSIREIHPSQLGRICPIETVEGKNAGLRISFTNEYNLNKQGFLQSPFFLRFNIYI